jgi:hypothetical protein
LHCALYGDESSIDIDRTVSTCLEQMEFSTSHTPRKLANFMFLEGADKVHPGMGR